MDDSESDAGWSDKDLHCAQDRLTSQGLGPGLRQDNLVTHLQHAADLRSSIHRSTEVLPDGAHDERKSGFANSTLKVGKSLADMAIDLESQHDVADRPRIQEFRGLRLEAIEHKEQDSSSDNEYKTLEAPTNKLSIPQGIGTFDPWPLGQQHARAAIHPSEVSQDTGGMDTPATELPSQLGSSTALVVWTGNLSLGNACDQHQFNHLSEESQLAKPAPNQFLQFLESSLCCSSNPINQKLWRLFSQSQTRKQQQRKVDTESSYYKSLEHVVRTRLGPARPLPSTWQLEAQTSGVTDIEVKNSLVELASLVNLGNRASWSALAAQLRALCEESPPRLQLVTLTWFVRSDSTPITLALEQMWSHDITQALRQIAEVGLTSVHEVMDKLLIKGQHTAQVAKVIQSDVQLGFLLRDPQGHLHIIEGTVASPLQFADHGTGETLREAELALQSLEGLNADLTRHCLIRPSVIYTKDLDSANVRLEKHNRATYIQETVPRHIVSWFCRVHRAQTVQGRVYDPVSTHISALVNISIAERGTGMYDKLLEVLGDELVASVRIDRVGRRPDADEPFIVVRKHILDLHLPIDAAAAARGPSGEGLSAKELKCEGMLTTTKRRMLLDAFLYCDITQDNLVYYPQPWMSDSLVQVLLRTTLVRVFLPSLLPFFPRHRWTGVRKPLVDISLLFAVGNLGARVFPKWVRLTTARSHLPSRPVLPAIGDASDRHTMLAIRDLEQEQESTDQANEQPAYGEAPAPAVAHSHAHPSAPASSTSFDWSEQNRKTKCDLFSWAQRQPAGPLKCTLRVSSVMEKLMHRYLWSASEKREQAEAAKAACGESAPVWRLLQAHKGEFEREAGLRVQRMLTEEQDWLMLAAHEKTLQQRALAFSMLSRACCGIHLLIRMPYALYPTRAFSVLSPDVTDAELDAIVKEECLWDEWSHYIFTEVFTTVDQLKSTLAQTYFKFLAQFVDLDISSLECSNGHIQRFCKGHSFHVSAVQALVASAHSTLQKQQQHCHHRQVDTSDPKPMGRPPKRRTRAATTTPLALEDSKDTGTALEPHHRQASAKPPKVTGKDVYNFYISTVHCQENSKKGNFGGNVFAGASEAYKQLKTNDPVAFARLVSDAKDDWEAKQERIARGEAPRKGNQSAVLPADVQRAIDDLRQPGSSRPSSEAIVPVPSEIDAALRPAARGSRALAIVGGNFHAVVKSTRSAYRAAGRLQRKARAEQGKKFVEWAAEESKKIAHFFPATPESYLGSVAMLPWPGESSSSYLRWRPPASEFAVLAYSAMAAPVSGIGRDDSTVALHAEIRRQWAKDMLMIKHADCTKLGKPKWSERMSSRCRNAHGCVCELGCGNVIVNNYLTDFDAAFRVLCRDIFKKGGKYRSELDNGHFVGCFEFLDHNRMRLWVHFGYSDLNSHTFGLMLLEEDTDGLNTGVARHYGNIALRSTAFEDHSPAGHEAMPFEQMGVNSNPVFFRPYPLEGTVILKPYRLTMRQGKLNIFMPGEVEVEQAGEEIWFWQGGHSPDRIGSAAGDRADGTTDTGGDGGSTDSSEDSGSDSSSESATDTNEAPPVLVSTSSRRRPRRHNVPEWHRTLDRQLAPLRRAAEIKPRGSKGSRQAGTKGGELGGGGNTDSDTDAARPQKDGPGAILLFNYIASCVMAHT